MVYKFKTLIMMSMKRAFESSSSALTSLLSSLWIGPTLCGYVYLEILSPPHPVYLKQVRAIHHSRLFAIPIFPFLIHFIHHHHANAPKPGLQYAFHYVTAPRLSKLISNNYLVLTRSGSWLRGEEERQKPASGSGLPSPRASNSGWGVNAGLRPMLSPQPPRWGRPTYSISLFAYTTSPVWVPDSPWLWNFLSALQPRVTSASSTLLGSLLSAPLHDPRVICLKARSHCTSSCALVSC